MTGNGVVLTGLPDGVGQVFEVVAVYRGPDGAELRSLPKTVTETPRGEARAIGSLHVTATQSGSRVQVRASWMRLDNSDVHLLLTDCDQPWPFGTVITKDTAERAGSLLFGHIDDNGPGRTLEAELPAGIHYLTPLSEGGTGVVVGKTRPVTSIKPPTPGGYPSSSRAAEAPASARPSAHADTTLLDVSIRSSSPGTYTVKVASPIAGEASAPLHLDIEELLSRHDQIQMAVLASATPSRRVLPSIERPVRDLGKLLFTALLGTGDVAGRYGVARAMARDRQQSLRVVLRINAPALAALPWETMYDESSGEYLCRHAPLVRHAGVASVITPMQVELPLRILGVISSPRGALELDVEKEQEKLEGPWPSQSARAASSWSGLPRRRGGNCSADCSWTGHGTSSTT